jgi:CHRD domain
MTYSNLEGNITQSHIHFGQRSVNGGISVFFCTNLGNGPAGTQACPGTHDGSISGTFGPSDVIGPTAQGISAGQWDELVAAIDAGKAYANIHSTIWPGGEIRAQLNETGDPHD